MNIRDITIVSLETITAFDITSGAYKFTLDELQNATISQTQEKTDITGKQGRKLSSLKRNKAVTISGTNGMVSHGLLELQTGCEFEYKAAEVMWCEHLQITTTDDGTASCVCKAVTDFKPYAQLRNDQNTVLMSGIIDHLFIKNEDGTLGAELTQLNDNGTLESDKFTYDASTRTISFYINASHKAQFANGTEIAVYYRRKIAADTLSNESDHYSEKCSLYIDAIGEDKCAKQYHVQFYIPKADFNGEFTFEMGDNQTVHAFEAEALSGACGLGGTLWTYTVFASDAADA